MWSAITGLREVFAMSIWGRLSAATCELSLGGQISSLLGFEPAIEQPKLYAEFGQ